MKGLTLRPGTAAKLSLFALVVCGLLVDIAIIANQKKPAAQVALFPAPFLVDPHALRAEAAVVYDPSDGRILYSKNAEMQLPLASLTKLMSADVALSVLGPESSVRLTPQALATEGDSGLKSGEVWRTEELMKYALLVSSNDAMTAVAQSAGTETFMNKMNEQAKALGLSQSYFLDPTGLDLTAGTAGAYGSARDIAVLASAFYKKYPAVFESTLRSGALFGGSTGSARGTATALPILNIPGLIGAKTGYTDLAGGNLVAMFDISVGHPVVAVVLHSTEDGRFEDIRTLVDAARASVGS